MIWNHTRTVIELFSQFYVRFEPDIYKPFTVALYSGTHKSKRFEEYLYKFICEINELFSNGLTIE